MIEMTGKNDFNGVFNFFRWSAPVYETPEEVVRAVNELGVTGKKLKSISAVGYATEPGGMDRGTVYEKVRAAGIDTGLYRYKQHCDEDDDPLFPYTVFDRDAYPNLDNVLVPCSVSVCEPLQLIFEDGTTLEILPVGNGAARVGYCTIPAGLYDGLNKSTLDAETLFCPEITAEPMKEFRIEKVDTATQYFDHSSIERSNPHTETRTEYRYQFGFEGKYRLVLSQDYLSWFTVELFDWNACISIPFSRATASVKKITQVPITPGLSGGGNFRITAYGKNGNNERPFFHNYGTSLDELYIGDFLEWFLYSSLDESMQEREEYESKGFDWNGQNDYSLESMRDMLAAIRGAARLLENDYDNPLLAPIKERMSVWSLGYDSRVKPTEEEAAEFKKEHIGVAVDFYYRFIERIEEMIENSPGCDTVSFAGP